MSDCRHDIKQKTCELGICKSTPAVLTREQVATINSMAHQIVLKWSQIVIGLNRPNGLSLKHDIETLVKDVTEQAITQQAQEITKLKQHINNLESTDNF